MSIDDAIRAALRKELEPIVAQLDAFAAALAQRPNAGRGGAEFVSAKEAAALAGVSIGTVRSWLRDNRIPTFRAGRLVRLRRADLLALLGGGPTTETPAAPEAQAARILARRQIGRLAR